ncbi:GyrI-like domain-containing protein [Ascidiimonas sp. W6]|uniref:GyrI-like domain-containing protein n=1 Tax=Ascidiimonas meishanensis TaxID=3128903 RepID=UPI0030EE68C1
MKKIIILFIIAAIAAVAWYLFVKPYDYRVAFNIKTSPGTAHEEILDFAMLNINLKTNNSVGFESVSQTLKLKDSTIQLNWHIKALNDSVSKITVDLTDPVHSLSNRISVPFSKSAIEKIARGMLIPFKLSFDQKLTDFRVEIVGEATIEEVFCACTSLKSSQKGKAYSMMSNNFVVDNLLSENGMKVTGNPFLKINKWIVDKKGIEFDFCFPTEKRDSLPKNPLVFFKTIPAQKAIKAVFYGNYKSSDRAWYALYDYATRNEIGIKLQPREVFFNNPNAGGDDKNWKSEIFMPLNK